MIKRYLSIFVILTIGVIVGTIWIAGPAGTADQPGSLIGNSTTGDQTSGSSPIEQQRITNLEVELVRLEQRLEALEQGALVKDGSTDANGELAMQSGTQLSTQTLQVTGLPGNPLPVVDGLVAAGLDPYTAQEIARKQSEVELRRLEIRDNAMREGYIGTERFREELGELREQQVKVRDEIDPASYDKYLYYTGQPNRVGVSSVLLGSAAEESGIREGDMILRYEDEPLYNGRDLRSATVQGERDEYVDVTVQRGDSMFTVTVPRGPLGVRLSPMTINPDKGQ